MRVKDYITGDKMKKNEPLTKEDKLLLVLFMVFIGIALAFKNSQPF